MSLELDKEELQRMKLVVEQLQENLISYMSEINACEFHDSHIDSDVLDTVCQIVVDTFKEVGV
jgi:hypothetical protein